MDRFAWIDGLKYDDRGLIGAIIQDAETKHVLMFAYMNRDSLRITVEEGRTCFWSRSRKQLWRKGETSGHTQEVKEIRYDCDRDCLLILVKQRGPACHTNHLSCFYNRVEPADGTVTECEPVIEDEGK